MLGLKKLKNLFSQRNPSFTSYFLLRYCGEKEGIFLFHQWALGWDHAGYSLVYTLLPVMKKNVYTLEEEKYALRDTPCNYPERIPFVIERVRQGAAGLLVCGSGIGMSIAANRYKGIRAALCTHEKMVFLSRAHNNANILVLGRSFAPSCPEVLMHWLSLFYNTPFEEGRHERRLSLIDEKPAGYSL